VRCCGFDGPRDGAPNPAKHVLKPWQHKQWCLPTVSAEFVAAMADVLELSAEPDAPRRPTVTFDETSRQLIAETRVPVPARPGQPRRDDDAYQRHGTRHLFLVCEPQAGWRHIEVTMQRTMHDFARQMRWLVDDRYPDAEVTRVVLDHLNTHCPAALYETFPPAEARRILKKLELHSTPKHASWLNMAEIELSLVSRQCLAGRIPDEDTLKRELTAYEQRRDADHATIQWRFTVQKARRKLHRLYPSIAH
jgi:DDE superfamily endonuclease